MKTKTKSSLHKLISLPLCAAALLAVTGGIFSQAQTVPTVGLVGYWPGNGNANDSSIYGNNGTFTGAYAIGVYGQAFNVSPASYFSAPNISAYAFTNAFSVGFWFYGENLSSSVTAFLGQDGGSGFNPKWFIDYNFASPGAFELYTYGSGGGIQYFPSNPVTVANAWHNLIVVYNATNCSFYLDGSSIGGTATVSAVLPQVNAPLTFGYVEGGYGYSGPIENVVLYNRSLTAVEIQQLSSPMPVASVVTVNALQIGSSNNATSSLITGTDGNFYGTTSGGGANNEGSVFQLTTSGSLRTLYPFTGGSDGGVPLGSLVTGSNGGFYGTTSQGGAFGYGTVFQLTSSGSLTTLYPFTGGTDGGNPGGGLATGTDGNFYGTTTDGGLNNAGTVFQITPSGSLTTLYSFTGGTDGGNPTGSLVTGSDGDFYGTTGTGGAFGYGTVFQITSGGSLTALYPFTGGTDGGNPQGGLVQGSNGNFYGTTSDGGVHSVGTVFQITSGGSLTTLYSFTGGTDGGSPLACLVQGSNGNLYGTTNGGGVNNAGTVFQITAGGSLTTLYSFTGGSAGGNPMSNLTIGPGGTLDGISAVGTSGTGAIFQVTLPPPPPTIASLAVSSVSINGATLGGTVNPDGVDTLVYFQYGTSVPYGNITPAQDIGGGTTAVPVSVLLSGLLPDTTFHYQLVTTSSAGTFFSGDMTFATLSPPSITLQLPSSVNLNVATLNGVVNPNGEDTQVWFQYGTSTSYSGTTGFQDIGSGTSSITLSGTPTGLQPNTIYHYQLAAMTGGDTFTSDDETFETVPQTQYYFSNFVGGFKNPRGVALDGSGNAYIADSLNNAIDKVTSAGVVTTLAGSIGVSGTVNGTGGAALFNDPQGVALDAKGNVYVADSENCTIRKVTPAGKVTTLAGQPGTPGHNNGTGTAAQFGWPASIALDGSGNVYVADGGNSEIRMVTPSGSVTTLAGSWQVSGTIDGAGTAAQFNYPNGIAFDPTSGNLFVADSYNNTIRKVTLSGTVTTLAGTPGVSGSADGLGTAAQFNNPTGVAVDADGNIYVADEGNSTIRKVTPAGEVTTIGGTPTVTGTANGIGSVAGFNLPFGVAVNAAGNVYVADTLNNRITIGLPQQVTGSTSSFNSTVGAVVSGSANPNGNAATVWFDYGPTNSYGYTTGSQTIGSGSNFVSVISTLTGPTLGVPWHYCLAFTSSAGIFYGADQTINAPGYTVNPAVVASATSVVLSGTVNPNGVAGPAKSGSNVLVSWQYGLTSGSYMATTSVTPIGTGTTAVSVSFTLTKKLKPAIYHYQIVISSTLGIIYGPDQTFSVDPPTVASLPPPTATFSGASPSASVNPNGLDTTVSFEYGTTTAYGSYTTGTDIGSGTSPVTVTLPLTGLAPDMAYYYRTVTTNVSGTTYGPVQEFATQALYGTSAVLWTSGAAPGIPGATFSALGDPATNDSDHLAFQATITGSTVGITSANNSGIWADIGTNGLTLIVQTGTTAPGYGPASPLYTGPAVSVGNFATLSDPVYADSDAVAFLGTLTQTGTGIWATTSGTLALVAKAGDPAPDEYGNVSSSSPVFASFSQFVLPNQGGVIFLATLATGTGGVTSSNNVGIWAVDTTGILKQIIRAGNALTVNGVAKVISKVVIFNAPAASTGQTRHFNNPGDLTYVLTFTDKSSSIVQSVFP